MPVVIEREIYLPERRSGVAFTTSAPALLGPGGPGWLGAQTVAAEATRAAREVADVDAVALFCPLPHAEDDAQRVALLIAWDGPVEDRVVDALRRVLDAAEPQWIPEGKRAIPAQAFGSVAFTDGGHWQLWHIHAGDTVASRLDLDDAGDVIITHMRADDAVPEGFLPGAAHALAVETMPPPDEQKAPLLEMMKVAWALDMSERVIDADGVVHTDELEVLTRTFPPRRLRQLGLDDRAVCVRLRGLARSELRHLLDTDQKFSLMALLYRMAQADLHVQAKEVRVLQDACRELDLSWTDVRKYLSELW